MAEKHSEVNSNSQETLHFLLESAVKFPNRQQCVIAEIIHLLNATEFDVKGLKTTLEFYRYLYPTAVTLLERKLFACDVLGEEDFTKPVVSSFLAKILFEVVTNSATECAEYCASVWVERVEAQHRGDDDSFKLKLPNPLQYLNGQEYSTLPSCNLSAISASFSMLTNEQRQMFMLECSSFLKSVPRQFYIRVIVGLFVFLELYKSQLSTDHDTFIPEVEVWADTWMNLLTSSLFGKFNKSSQQKMLIQTQRHDLSVHHILCGLMVSTNSFKLLRSYSSTRKKLLTELEQLILCSSGFTSTWLNTIKIILF